MFRHAPNIDMLRSRLTSSHFVLRRNITTETIPSSSSPELLPFPSRERSRTAAKLSPSHRPVAVQSSPSPQPQPRSSPAEPPIARRAPESPLALPYLFPRNFGQNQRLSVPDSTRALLEELTNSFDAPIRYAFAYGSGVFTQDGYSRDGVRLYSGFFARCPLGTRLTKPSLFRQPAPLLDFVFAVNHPSHWHSMNLHQYPSHYPLHARMFGSEVIARVQRISPGIWFNTYVSISGTVCSSPTVAQKIQRLIFAVCKSIKYGVTTVDNLCSDLLSWNTLYLSGRMHKPIRIIKDDARVRLTQQVNLVSALRVALLTLPDKFDERRLFERMAGFSYAGDPRMSVPGGENRGKVANIVSAQAPQFRELYQRLANGLPSVRWRVGSSTIEASSLAFLFVDMSFGSRMSYFIYFFAARHFCACSRGSVAQTPLKPFPPSRNQICYRICLP